MKFTNLSPATLLKELKRLQAELSESGRSDTWDLEKKYLFNYVDMYQGHIKMEDDMPDIAFRTVFIKAKEPFSDTERATVEKAVLLKRQIASQLRALKLQRGE